MTDIPEFNQSPSPEKWIKATPKDVSEITMLLKKSGIDKLFVATSDIIMFNQPDDERRPGKVIRALHLASSELKTEKAIRHRPAVAAAEPYPIVSFGEEDKSVHGIAIVRHKDAPLGAYNEERKSLLDGANAILKTFDQPPLPEL